MQTDLGSEVTEKDLLIVLKWDPNLDSFELKNVDEVYPIKNCIMPRSRITEGDKICIKNKAKYETKVNTLIGS